MRDLKGMDMATLNIAAFLGLIVFIHFAFTINGVNIFSLLLLPEKLDMFKKLNPWKKGIAANLPAAYKHFFDEWKNTQPMAVQYIPKPANTQRMDSAKDLLPIRDIPIPLKYPTEYDKQIWGGEGIIQGFTKKKRYNRRNPTFWFPTLHRSVVYSEILDKHISVVLTERTLQLINTNYGFDHYILKTPACDLKSLLSLGLKRKMLQSLESGCPSYLSNPQKQQEVLQQYKMYLTSYTTEEIDWYGYSFREACDKWLKIVEAQKTVSPLKLAFRENLTQKLRAEFLNSANIDHATTNEQSWLVKLNPFSKK